MSNIIEIPNLTYDTKNEVYREDGNQLINLDNISIVEPRFYNNGNLSRFMIYFSKDTYTHTNQRGYDLIKNFSNKINESAKDTIL